MLISREIPAYLIYTFLLIANDSLDSVVWIIPSDRRVCVYIREYYLLITRVGNPCLIQISKQDIPHAMPNVKPALPIEISGIISRYYITDLYAY